MLDKIEEINKQTEGEIIECINARRFKPIFKNGEWVGFVTWNEVWKNDKRHIFIRNLYIGEKYRNEYNLLFLRKFFKNIYDRIDFKFVFWHNGKKDRFFYAK